MGRHVQSVNFRLVHRAPAEPKPSHCCPAPGDATQAEGDAAAEAAAQVGDAAGAPAPAPRRRGPTRSRPSPSSSRSAPRSPTTPRRPCSAARACGAVWIPGRPEPEERAVAAGTRRTRGGCSTKCRSGAPCLGARLSGEAVLMQLKCLTQ
jgi:hypothetical protein